MVMIKFNRLGVSFCSVAALIPTSAKISSANPEFPDLAVSTLTRNSWNIIENDRSKAVCTLKTGSDSVDKIHYKPANSCEQFLFLITANRKKKIKLHLKHE